MKKAIIITLLGFAGSLFAQSVSQQDLFISEYVEGSGNNKYIEIYNPLSTSVDLSDYELRLYYNGASSAGNTSSLSGTLASGAVIVYANSSATAYSGSVTTLSTMNFNGNDAIELYNTKDSRTADVFGRIGCNPGSQWIVSGNGTQNQTLRRVARVCQGVQNPTSSCGQNSFDSLGVQWQEFSENDVTGLGFHSSVCVSCSSPTDVINPQATVLSGKATISWTPSVCFDSVYVFIDTTSGIQSTPTGDGSSYTADSAFSTIGQLVYEGDDTVFTLTGLWNDTTFSIEIFSRKGSSWSGGIDIQVTPREVGAPANPGAIGTIITFDETLPGINEGVFSGAGLSPSPQSGQLNSNSWRVEGLSDGNTVFGQSYTGGDYARGSSSGNVSSGGLYAFEVAPSDMALGVQPAGSDFTPGCIVLRIRNNSEDTLKELGLSYHFCYNNNEGRANSLTVDYSSDDVSWNALAELSDTTPESSDNNGWQQKAKSSLVGGLNVLPGEFFYMRWCSDDVSGGGSRDEIAIDDIQLAANPGPCDIFATYTTSSPSANGASDGSIDIDLKNAGDLRYVRWSHKTGVNYPKTNEFDANQLEAGEYTLFIVTEDLCPQYIGPIELK